MLAVIMTLPFDGEVAARAGSMQVDLESKGQPIGLSDVLIAAHALTLNLTRVTNNTKNRARVRGLRREDWAAPISTT